MPVWFYKVKDAEVGPLSSRQLIAAVLAGAVDFGTDVRENGDQTWTPAQHLEGLFEAAAKARDGDWTDAKNFRPGADDPQAVDSEPMVSCEACGTLIQRWAAAEPHGYCRPCAQQRLTSSQSSRSANAKRATDLALPAVALCFFGTVLLVVILGRENTSLRELEIARARGAKAGYVDGRKAGYAAGYEQGLLWSKASHHHETMDKQTSSGDDNLISSHEILIGVGAFVIGFMIQYLAFYLARAGRLLNDADRILIGQSATTFHVDNAVPKEP